MKQKIAFKTLGCRLNQYETDALVSQFHKGNYEIVDFSENADICIINTCTVTDRSDQKSLQYIRQAFRKKKPLVVVTGCMAGHYQEQLETQGQNSLVVPNEQKSSIFSLVDAHMKGEILPPGNVITDNFDYQVAEKSFHTRCMVKIQDGCDNFCTFCIIPMVRGRAVSRPSNDILDNIRKALDLGYKEMVLTGVNLGRYQWGDLNFETLVEQILRIKDNFRLRISSIEPDGFGDRFFDLLGEPKMCPHLHLCLQSGSDKVLLQMRRMYTRSSYLAIIEKIRKKYPSFNFTTDVIAGFPGETDADFEATCDMIRQIGFSHVHTFPYSVREGTRAKRMPDQVPEKIKKQRAEIIREISEKNNTTYRLSFIGKTQMLLSEKINRGIGKGYGEHYIPITVEGNDLKPNTFYKTLITEMVPGGKEPVMKGKILT